MPNKTWNMYTDLLPGVTGSYNIGNTNKKWIVNGYDLAPACAKGVTDYTSESSPDSSDLNLITGRALYWVLQGISLASITDDQIDELFKDGVVPGDNYYKSISNAAIDALFPDE